MDRTESIIRLILLLVDVALPTYLKIMELLKIGETEALAMREALVADRPKLDALIDHLKERVPED